MRQMRNIETGSTINVAEHIITRNFWEFYLEEADENETAFGLVMGFENELGYVSLEEIGPHIIGRANVDDVSELFPASGWEWVDN